MEWKYKILKYGIGTGSNILRAPKDSTVVHFGADSDGSLCVWLKVRIAPACREAELELMVVGTGEICPEEGWHKQTCVTPSGDVWHLFTESC